LMYELEAVCSVLSWILYGLLDGASLLGCYHMHHLCQREAPLQALQNCDLLSINTYAKDQFQDFLRQRREAHESQGCIIS
jgi:uncharacterized membrane protein